MIQLSSSQQAIVNLFPAFLMDDSTEFVIAGFAGSGKTFLVKYLAEVIHKQQELIHIIDKGTPKRAIHYTATTNKAAGVLEDTLGSKVITIYSLLGLRVTNNYTNGKQVLKNTGKGYDLTNTIVFIDEASMIERDLLAIIRSIPKDLKCKIVFCGDPYQLPPVMEEVSPVFADTSRINYLVEIHRQAKDSPIITLSGQYRAMLDDHTLNWPTIQHDGRNIFYYQDKEPFFDAIRQGFTGLTTDNSHRVLAWSNNRVREYNNWIRSLKGRTGFLQSGEVVATNKPLFLNKFIVAPTDHFETISNIRPAQVRGIDGYYITLRGYVDKDGGDDPEFFHPNDWKEADNLAKTYAAEAKKDSSKWVDYFHIKENWVDFRPIHASTVHKSQGSTYKHVYVDLNNIGKNNHWREVVRLVYVAITRASQSVHIYGSIDRNYNKTALIDLMEPFRNVPQS